MSNFNESGYGEKRTEEQIRVDKDFEAKVLEYMFKQWGIDWDLNLLFANYIRGDIESEVRILNFSQFLTKLGFQTQTRRSS